MPQKNQPRTLRACVVQGGKVTDETRFRKREPLSIGRGPRNNFVVSDPGLPKTHQLFLVRAGEYELVLTDSMAGKISGADSKPVDFASLKTQGLLKKQGDYYHLKLNDEHRGKVTVGGDTTVIFQFVTPRPEPVKPKLPASAKGSLWKNIDWIYMGTLLALVTFEVPSLMYLLALPPAEELTLDKIDERWAKLIAPEMKKDEKKPEKKERSETKVAEAKKEDKKEEEPEKKEETGEQKAARAERSQKIRSELKSKGILAILGTTGAGSAAGAVADVFADGGISSDLDSAFDGIAGVDLAAGNKRTTRGGAAGEAASIGGLATEGAGKVGLGGKTERRVAAMSTEAPEVDGSLDSEAIADVVRRRQRSIQECYEKELKRNPGLSGKIEIEFTIGSDGAVEDARVATNRMGSDAVGACIVARIRRWRFPAPDGGSVTVTFPFIFTSSS